MELPIYSGKVEQDVNASVVGLISAKKRISSSVQIFQERSQELTTVIKRLSSTGFINDSDRKKFDVELKDFHTLPPEILASNLNTR